MRLKHFLAWFCAATSIWAQSGAIEGLVRDPSGAAVSGAQVRIVQPETGLSRGVESDESGRYRVLDLGPGAYRVEVENAGFRRAVREPIPLAAGRTVLVDFSLQLGELREEVVVSADPPLLSTAAMDWGGLVDSRNLESLPLNGRDLFELSALEPGAALPPAARNGLAQGLGRQISVNGSRPNQNAFQIDGVYVNDATSSMPASAAGRMLGIETVREIHLVTNPFSAEYGRTAGGLFTAVSKSGSNAFHGALYEFFRNSELDAKNFFDAPGEAIPPLRRNQFGGVLSGPAVRDKLFFLFNYEGLRQRRGRTERPTVPSLDARRGILPSPDGGVREVSVAAPVRPFLDLFPAPNGRDFGDGTAEFIAQRTSATDEDYFSGKADYLISDKVRVAARYTGDFAENADPDPFGIWTFSLESRDHFFHSDIQTVHSPDTISNIRVGFSRVNNLEDSAVRPDVDPALSFVPGLPLGTLTVTGLSDFGGFQARARPRNFIVNNFQVNGDLTKVSGRNVLRVGGGFDRAQFNQKSDLSAVGSFTFNSLENLLLGAPDIAEVAEPGSDTLRRWRYFRFHAFIQEELRLAPTLSLSLGARWEAVSTPTELDDKIAVLRDPLNDPAPTVGGPLWTNPSWDNVAPRAALAWDPFGDGKTVIRAGGGIFFDLLGSRELVIAGVRTPPFFNRILVFGRPVFPDILRAAEGRAPSASVDGVDYDLQQPYVGRWQLNVERQVGADHLLRVGYSGLRGVHLMGQIGNINTPVPEFLPDGRTFFPADAPRLNPAFARIGLRRSQFNSFYQGLTLGVEKRGRDRLRYQAKYTWSKSIDESSNATFNDFEASDQVPTTTDFRANRGRSDFDLRHLFAGSVSYLLPRFDGGPAPALLGGWEIHGLTQWQSGNPFAPSVGFDQARLRAGFGDVGQRPDLARPGGNLILGDPERFFDPTAFSLPRAGFLGNLGRGTLVGPDLFSLDLAFHKELFATERQRLKLRAEFFNITNRPNFQIPSEQELFNDDGGRVGSAGRVTATTTGSRQIQLALRWEF